MVYYPRTSTSITCLFEDCPGRATSWTNRQIYFIHRNVEDTIFFSFDKGMVLLLQCGQFDIFVTRKTSASGHLDIEMCSRMAVRKRHRLSANSARVAAGTEFWARDQVLDKLDTFKTLWRILSSDDINWTVACRKLKRVRRKWDRFSLLLSHDGVDTRTSRRFYVALVQSLLIFRAETWVVMPHFMWALGSLHHRGVRQIYGWIHWCQKGHWYYPHPPPHWIGSGWGGVGCFGAVHISTPHHCDTLHYHAANIWPSIGIGDAARILVDPAMVGSWEHTVQERRWGYVKFRGQGVGIITYSL